MSGELNKIPVDVNEDETRKSLPVPSSRRSTVKNFVNSHGSRRFLLMIFYCSVVWNTLSPFKSWILGRYSLIDGGQINIDKMNWSVPIDPDFLTGIYKQAGVDQQNRPGKPERYVNLYLDFMVHHKSKRWAPYVNDQHKDEYAGRYCRTGFRYNRANQIADIQKLSKTGIKVWADVYFDFLVDQKTCRVSEVPEALLCLKGYRGLDLLNLEWSTNRKVTDSIVIKGIAGWQQKLMPDLENCLSRRKLLVASVGYNEGLIKLSEEISKNYSLILENVAGLPQSYAKFIQERGFIDISGFKSGKRTAQLNGHMYSRNMKDLDGDLNAMTVIRETLWVCAFSKQPFGECLLGHGHSVPAATQMKYLNLKTVAARYIENRLFQKGTSTNNITEYTLTPIKAGNKKYDYVDEKYFKRKVESEYKVIYRLLIEKANGLKAGFLKGGMKICFVTDGCFEECNAATSIGRWAFAFKRSGKCQSRRVSSDLINPQGYVSEKCFGFGSGNSSLYLEIDENGKYNSTINNVADPGAVLACVLGGRIPNGEFFPTYFLDSVEPGTGSVMMSVLVDGSEKTLLNFYSLITLVGCFCFGFWVIKETYYLQKNLHKTTKYLKTTEVFQAAHGIYFCNIACRVWGQYYYRMQIVGLLSIISWFLGAINSRCKWSVAQSGTGISPNYSCNAGEPFNIVSSFGELVRLFSSSYVFFAVVFQCKKQLVGVTRNAVSYMVAVMFFGFIPCLISSILITLINILRFELELTWIHNQLFVSVMWISVLGLWSSVLGSIWIRMGIKVLNLAGQKRQTVQSGSVAHEFAGSSYWERAELVRVEPIEWIPLSVYVELARGDLTKVLWEQRRILPDGIYSKREQVEVPQWVEVDQDFYIG